MNQIVRSIPEFLYQIFSYREYLIHSVSRDLKNKYKRSVLGYFWTMLHPLAMMTVLAVVFSHIMKIAVQDYAVFLFCGLLPWNYFNSTAMMSLSSIRANSRLFGQIPVPKYIFVLSLAFSNLFNLFVAIIPLLVIMLVLGRPIPPTILLFPLFLIPIFCVVIGVSLILATLNVFFDDTLHLTEVGMSILYFLCPVLYQRESLPPHLVNWLTLNPLFAQIEFFRGLFYTGTLPDLHALSMNFLASLAVLLVGLVVFRRNEDKFLYFI